LHSIYSYKVGHYYMPQLIYYCFIKYCSMYYLLEFQSIPPANAISGIVIIETKVDIAITSDA